MTNNFLLGVYSRLFNNPVLLGTVALGVIGPVKYLASLHSLFLDYNIINYDTHLGLKF